MQRSSADAVVPCAYFCNIKVVSVSCSSSTSRAGLEITVQIFKDPKNYFRLVQKIQESIVYSLTYRFLSKFPIIIPCLFNLLFPSCSKMARLWKQ